MDNAILAEEKHLPLYKELVDGYEVLTILKSYTVRCRTNGFGHRSSTYLIWAGESRKNKL